MLHTKLRLGPDPHGPRAPRPRASWTVALGSLAAAALFAAGSAGAGAYGGPELEVVSRDARGIPTFVRGELGTLNPDGDLAREAELFLLDFVVDHLGAVGDESFHLRAERRDDLGQAHFRFDQQLNGLRAVGAQLIVHVDVADGTVTAVNGRFARAEESKAPAGLDGRTALADALAGVGVEGQSLSRPEAIYVAGSDGLWRRAWQGRYRFKATGEKSGLSGDAADEQVETVVADASGRLLARYPDIYPIRDRLTYRGFLDKNGIFDFFDTLLCTETSLCNGSPHGPTHANAGDTYDYYLARHGRDSFDGKGASVVSSVGFNTTTGINNAFWSDQLQTMIFGDGDGVTFSALGTALDVVAHELTHGVTRAESDLIYAGESGALNESLSDIFAAAVEEWRRGPGSHVYILGEDVYTPFVFGDALRYMDDPVRDGFSADFYPDRNYPGACTPSSSNDNCGVHSNSGISNLAFNLLAEGGLHPRGKSTINVQGVGIGPAAKIFYRAQTTYLGPSSDFEDARSATVAAAVDLYGPGSAQVRSVHEAWCAVAVPGCPDVLNPSFSFSCTGLSCSFQPLTGSATIAQYRWTFPGGSSTVASPSFFFPGYGGHAVTLKVTDSSGLVGSVSQTVSLSPAATINPTLGGWYNPQRNGNGIEIYRTTDGRYGLAWYTYLADGTPTWYQSDVVAKGTATWQSALRRATWNGTSATLTNVGTVALDFSNSGEAWFSWTLNGQSGGERFEFLFGGAGRSGAWFTPSEPGWGIAVQEQNGTLGSAVTFYENGQPRWVSGVAPTGTDVTVPLRWRYGVGLCPTCSGGSTTPPASLAAGTIRLQIAGGSSTTGTATVDITTPSAGTWDRGPVAIQLLTQP